MTELHATTNDNSPFSTGELRATQVQGGQIFGSSKDTSRLRRQGSSREDGTEGEARKRDVEAAVRTALGEAGKMGLSRLKEARISRLLFLYLTKRMLINKCIPEN
jgi:hypothetical protein